jgi:hypothetical protein
MKKCLSIILGCFAAGIVLFNTTACHRDPVYIGELPIDPIDTSGGGGTVIVHPCSPDSVYFEQQLLPILQSNCAVPSCHDAASHEEGIIYDSYTNTRNTGKISLSNPAGSKMYKVLSDPDPDDRMPPAPRAALSAEQKALVLKWMQQGALNIHCDAACDTTNVKFSTVIKPLIATKCQGCHSASSPGGGIQLTTYAEIKAQVSNQKLWGSITHDSGYKPMPYPAGSAKMPQCELDQVRIWIQAGSPNN